MKTTATFLTLRIPGFEAAIRKAVDARLADRPVVVVTSFKQQGRVIAACPEARAQGIAEEMHFPEARLCCPDAAFHLPDKSLADRAMRSLLGRAGKYTPLVEPAGGGRVLLDTRGTERLWGDNCRVGELLRRDVVADLRLPAAAGLATCRPWSNLASRAAGDDGICHVAPGTEDSFLNQAPIAWVDGLTPRTRTLLLEMNIRSLGQIRHFGQFELRRQFGRTCGDTLWNMLHPGPWDAVSLLSDDTLLEMEANRVRVEAVLAEASVVEEKLRLVVRTLAARIAASLRARRLGAARLRLVLLHADGALKTVESRLGGFSQEETALQAAAERLLARAFARRVKVFRLWLEAEKLSGPERQGVLFPEEAAETHGPNNRLETQRLLTTVDDIKKRYGDGAVRPAALLDTQKRGRGGRKRLPFSPEKEVSGGYARAADSA